MADGKGCKCGAYGECECGCDADWTPQEVYDLRDRVKELQAHNRALVEALSDAVYQLQNYFKYIRKILPNEADSVSATVIRCKKLLTSSQTQKLIKKYEAMERVVEAMKSLSSPIPVSGDKTNPVKEVLGRIMLAKQALENLEKEGK